MGLCYHIRDSERLCDSHIEEKKKTFLRQVSAYCVFCMYEETSELCHTWEKDLSESLGQSISQLIFSLSGGHTVFLCLATELLLALVSVKNTHKRCFDFNYLWCAGWAPLILLPLRFCCYSVFHWADASHIGSLLCGLVTSGSLLFLASSCDFLLFLSIRLPSHPPTWGRVNTCKKNTQSDRVCNKSKKLTSRQRFSQNTNCVKAFLQGDLLIGK